MNQQSGLVAPVYLVHGLGNGVHSGVHRVHRYPHGMMKQALHQLSNLLRHSGREKQGLLPAGQPFEDLFHVVDKAHVQHPVCLVQHKNFQPGQVQQLLLIQVCQTARRGHQNIGALLNGFNLRILSHAAENDHTLQGQIGPVGFKALLVLNGKLPGGGQDQRPDGTTLCRFCVQTL